MELLRQFVGRTTREGKAILAAAEWLLQNQYIMAQGFVGLWRVVKGSGMGWPQSPAVVDGVFLVNFDRMVLQRALSR